MRLVIVVVTLLLASCRCPECRDCPTTCERRCHERWTCCVTSGRPTLPGVCEQGLGQCLLECEEGG